MSNQGVDTCRSAKVRQRSRWNFREALSSQPTANPSHLSVRHASTVVRSLSGLVVPLVLQGPSRAGNSRASLSKQDIRNVLTANFSSCEPPKKLEHSAQFWTQHRFFLKPSHLVTVHNTNNNLSHTGQHALGTCTVAARRSFDGWNRRIPPGSTRAASVPKQKQAANCENHAP